MLGCNVDTKSVEVSRFVLDEVDGTAEIVDGVVSLVVSNVDEAVVGDVEIAVVGDGSVVSIVVTTVDCSLVVGSADDGEVDEAATEVLLSVCAEDTD